MSDILKEHSILYVEDEPSIRKNIIEYLESYFGTVHTASDGAEALEAYYKHYPDVALLDINLPYIDGLSVAKEIRSQNPKTKIVMLTAHTEKEKLLRATELKLTKYLIKPISPKTFKETMHLLAEELLADGDSYLSLSDGYVWDSENERLFKNSLEIPLSTKERTLLKACIEKHRSVITYEEIMIAVWEDAFDRDISIDSVKNQVSLLRKKLPAGCLESVYGKGYRLK